MDLPTAEMLVNCGRKNQKTPTTMATETSGESQVRSRRRAAGATAAPVGTVDAAAASAAAGKTVGRSDDDGADRADGSSAPRACFGTSTFGVSGGGPGSRRPIVLMTS